jgi:hypothetical protein
MKVDVNVTILFLKIDIFTFYHKVALSEPPPAPRHKNPAKWSKARVIRPENGRFLGCRFVIRIAGRGWAGKTRQRAIFSRIARVFWSPPAWQVPVVSGVWTLSVTTLA